MLKFINPMSVSQFQGRGEAFAFKVESAKLDLFLIPFFFNNGFKAVF
jgi:hypothetical protein